MKSLSNRKLCLYLAGLFLAGVVTGAFGSFAIGRHVMMKAMSQEKMAAHWRSELQSKLNLSPQQAQAIAPIVNEAITGFKAVFAEQMLNSLSNANARIAGQLTAEQMPKFAEMEKQQQAFIRERFHEAPENPQKKP